MKIYELTVENADDPGLPAPKSFYVTNNVVHHFNGFTAVQNDKDWVLNAYTNSAGYNAGAVTNYIQANHIDWADAQVNYTNLPANYAPDNSGPAANPADKPVVTRTYEPDPALEETERILEDYISLLPKSAILTADH